MFYFLLFFLRKELNTKERCNITDLKIDSLIIQLDWLNAMHLSVSCMEGGNRQSRGDMTLRSNAV